MDKILLLAPHTDDCEFGCGGAISRWVGEGKEIYQVAFSSCGKSLPEGQEDILKVEIKQATAVLGLDPKNLMIFDYQVREFPRWRQRILEDMVLLHKEIKPDLVVMPSTSDTHQDHAVVREEGFRAFKDCSIIGYEMPHNNLSFNTDLFIRLNEFQLGKKIEALECYKSQGHREYANREFVESLARIRGIQIKTEYAEAFEVIRWVI
jgi:LmbE family N-acetylglucosaminyl deacetylase